MIHSMNANLFLTPEIDIHDHMLYIDNYVLLMDNNKYFSFFSLYFFLPASI